jgi:hypothetical protein
MTPQLEGGQVNQIWYVGGLVKYLNELGYVHFITKEHLKNDFENGSAFFYNTAKKEYGALEFVTSESIERAFELMDLMTNLIDKREAHQHKTKQ